VHWTAWAARGRRAIDPTWSASIVGCGRAGQSCPVFSPGGRGCSRSPSSSWPPCRWPAAAWCPVEVHRRQRGRLRRLGSEGRGHEAARAARGPSPPHQRWPVLVLTPPTVGCLPPAYWPPGLPEDSWCWRGELPGRQGRMSGTPPLRSSPRHGHSPLTACPEPRVPATAGGGEGTRLRRVLLRWQAPQPWRSQPGATVAEAVDPLRWTLRGTLRWTLRRPPAYPSPGRSAVPTGHAPSWGQSAAKTAADWPPSGEWSGRAERCASRD
jgi:hypothetical protein